MKKEIGNNFEASETANFSAEERDVLRRIFNNPKRLSPEALSSLSGLGPVYGKDFSSEDLFAVRDYFNGKITQENGAIFARFAPYAKNMLRVLKSTTEEQFFAPQRGGGDNKTGRKTPPSSKLPDLDNYDKNDYKDTNTRVTKDL